MKLTKEIDCTFMRLMEVERSLFHLYKRLGDVDNKEQYLEYLAITVEVEDKILNSMDLTCENSNQLLKRYRYLVLEKGYSEDEIFSLTERFRNYLQEKLFSKPFKSVRYDKEMENNDNIVVVTNIARRDYVVNLLFLLGDAIQKEENLATKKVLEPPFHKLCFENKAFEQALTNPIKTPAINGRKRCIDFGHEEDIITMVYQKLYYCITNTLLDQLFQYPDALLKENSYARDVQKVSLINLKGASYLLNEKELQEEYQKYYHIITEESPLLQQFYGLTTNNLLSTLKSSYEEVKAYQKVNK